jgi:toxin secretion/phage lysis holin
MSTKTALLLAKAAELTILGTFGGVISAILGPWGIALEALAILMALDYLTGLILAGVFHASPKSKGGTLESRAALKGLLRKCGIIIIVVALHQADRLTGKAFLRDGAAFAFCVEEILSLVENLGAMGVPMPGFVRKALEWLHDKSDSLTNMIPTKADQPPDAAKPSPWGEGGTAQAVTDEGDPDAAVAPAASEEVPLE